MLQSCINISRTQLKNFATIYWLFIRSSGKDSIFRIRPKFRKSLFLSKNCSLILPTTVGFRLNYPRSEYDDGDSQFSFSNSSSPTCQVRKKKFESFHFAVNFMREYFQLSNSEDNGLSNADIEV